MLFKCSQSNILTPWAPVRAKNDFVYIDKCCLQKEVGGKIYTFLDNISEDEKERLKCSNTCAYSYKNGEKDQKFCFL